jgi:hypothetical protein
MATMKKPAKKMQMGGFTKSATMMKNGGGVDSYTDYSKTSGKEDTYTDYSGKTSKADSYTNYKMGGKIKKAKSGGSFPDLNKDGKITKADVLVGRGVVKAKKGIKMKAGGKVASMKPKAGTHKMPDGSIMKNSMMKSGGKMKGKC